MSDKAAQAVIKRIWGDSRPSEVSGGMQMAPIERYMQFRRLNNEGWTNIIRRHGPDGAQQYREAMLKLGKDLGLEG